ncbi:MAG: metal-dependent hydrolase [Cyanobacteria bacterium NC_groundwater_1444_Ag_S-0.65um_54_12]|nr:metal-dependent hydrolase [Cyanobacteria bacterium NC_groundwater_1444_Ag_S-0.65um_54_12]
MTAPTHAAFGTLCYFIVAACLWWTVSPTVAASAVLGALLPDIDIPTSALGRPLFPLAGAIKWSNLFPANVQWFRSRCRSSHHIQAYGYQGYEAYL